MAAFGFGPAVVSAGYNKASNDTGKAVTNGFGGGPYFTSMEEMTIDGLNDAEAYMVGAELDFADLGIEGLVLAAAYASFESGSGDEADEIDVIVGYALNEQFEAEVSYAEIDDARDTLDGDWSRWLVRLNYNF
jgi:predicted porin